MHALLTVLMEQFMYKVAKKQIKDQQLRASHSDTVTIFFIVSSTC